MNMKWTWSDLLNPIVMLSHAVTWVMVINNHITWASVGLSNIKGCMRMVVLFAEPIQIKLEKPHYGRVSFLFFDGDLYAYGPTIVCICTVFFGPHSTSLSLISPTSSQFCFVHFCPY